MLKKITTLLCAAAITAAALPAVGYSQSNAADDKASLLYAVGIEDGTAGSKATRDYFVKALSGFVYNAEEKISPEVYARNVGITEFGEVYDGSEKLTVEEALKYAVIALGYKEYAASKGDNGYNGVAASIGLTSGVDISAGTATVDACRQILYNMLEIEPMSATLEGGQTVYKIDRNETLLSKYRNIYTVDGIITANEQTSLSSENGCSEGYIEIDEVLYKTTDDIANDETLLGKSVEAYIMTDKFDDASVLYAGEKRKNIEITIDAEDVLNVPSDFSQIKYEDSDKIKYAKLAAAPKVVYNGVFCGAYTEADFKPEIGSLRLVDCDSDGKYETIFIYSYETFVLGAADTKEKILYNKFKITDRLYSVDLGDDDVRYTITDGEKEIAFTDLKSGDILSIAVSKSTSNKIANILVSTENMKGSLSRIDGTDREIVIDDEIYTFIEDFTRFNTESNKSMVLGNKYKFYFDVFGNIAYCESLAEDGYAVIYKFTQNESEDKYYVTYMNMNGEWVDAEIADRMSYDDTVYKYASSAYEDLKTVRGKIVKLTINASGAVKKIESPTLSGTPNPNKFIYMSVSSEPYRKNNRSFGCKYYFDDNAKLIVLPTNLNDKQGYSVREPSGYFAADEQPRVTIYDFDEYGFTNLISTTYEPKVTSSLFITTGVSSVLTSDGDPVGQLKGYTVDFDNVTLMGDTADRFSTVSKGNILKLGMNWLGRVDKVEVLGTLGDSFAPVANGAQYSGNTYLAGTVTAIDATAGKMSVDISGTSYKFRIDGTEVVQLFDAENKEVTSATVYGIVPGDQLFMYLSWGVIKNIIING